MIDIAALVAEVSLLQQEARIRRAIGDGLAAEVERLLDALGAAHAEAATMRAWAEEAAKAENENAEDARKERVAVVAWIRRVATDASWWGAHGGVYDGLADAIESGEHRREEKE